MEPITDKKTEALQVNVILTALGTDKQELAAEIGEDRANLSNVLSGRRPGKRTRKKLARAICARVERLIIGEDSVKGEESEVKAA